MTSVEWLEFECEFIQGMNIQIEKITSNGYCVQDGIKTCKSAISKSEKSLNHHVESLFSESNFNKKISPELSSYILRKVEPKNFFKVQKATNVYSWKIQGIVSRKYKLTKRTAKAIEMLTRIAIENNTKGIQS